MGYKLKWRGKEVESRVRRLMGDRLNTAATFAVRQIQQNIGRQGPPASTPGEYPHRQSGELQAGVHAVIDRRELTAKIVSSADHSRPVEELRPFMLRTLREIFSRLKRIVRTGS